MIWVISFPWTNCETETKRALENAWINAEIFRWNEDEKTLNQLDWFVIAWWFSFEDRWRSWVIASNYPIIEILREASKNWKSILWICNWAQILVESGLVTDSIWPRISLSENKRINSQWHIVWTWFYNTWTFLKPNKKSVFSNFDQSIHIPLAHAEGRFIIAEDEIENVNITFQYSDEKWEILWTYPTNPNGSFENAAAISNKRWNVMAIMPHPERTENWQLIFASLKNFLNNEKKVEKLENLKEWKEVVVKNKINFQIEIYTKLIITDNEAESIKKAISNDENFELEKYKFIWINLEKESDFEKLESLIFAWEFWNFEKEKIFIKKWWKTFRYLKDTKEETAELEKWLNVRYYDDIDSLETKENLESFWIESQVATWKYWVSNQNNLTKNLLILANPVSQFIEK